MKNCNNIQEKLIGYIEKDLPKEESDLVKNHLNSCKECEEELKNIQSFLTVLSSEKQEIPTDNLRFTFNKMLSEEKLTSNTKVIPLKPEKKWKEYLRIVASIVVVVSAFLIGKYQADIKSISAINQSKKEQKVVAMLDNQSASKRILAIDLSEEFTTKNTKIIEALISRLFNDENTNVRLASAEALSKFTSLEIVRNSLIKALETEKEATVQIELIQILAKIQEKRAVKPMKILLKKEETPTFVKHKLQYGISELM